MNASQVAVVIPCYNSATTIENVVTDVKKYISDVIVVDDGSQDESAENASRVGAVVLSLDKNMGVGKATQTGIQVALEMKKEIIITLDSDAAHNPANISGLLRYHLSSDYLLTIGNRWSNYNVHVPSQKWWANQFASVLINRIFSTKIPDVACGFRVFSKEFAEQIINGSMANGFGFIYQQVFIAKNLGKIGFAPVDVRYDANSLLATKQNELLHLLEISQKYCTDNDLRDTIKKIATEATLLKIINVKLLNNNCTDHIVLHPLISQNSYLFQWQHPDFLTKTTKFHQL